MRCMPAALIFAVVVATGSCLLVRQSLRTLSIYQEKVPPLDAEKTRLDQVIPQNQNIQKNRARADLELKNSIIRVTDDLTSAASELNSQYTELKAMLETAEINFAETQEQVQQLNDRLEARKAKVTADTKPIYKLDNVWLDVQVPSSKFESEYYIYSSGNSDQFRARFLYKKKKSGARLPIMLGEHADLRFQGQRPRFNVYNPGQSTIGFWAWMPEKFSYYHPGLRRSEFLNIVYSHHDGRVYSHRIRNIAPIQFPPHVRTLSRTNDLIIDWVGAPLEKGESIVVMMKSIGVSVAGTAEEGIARVVVKSDNFSRIPKNTKKIKATICRTKDLTITDKGGPSGKAVVRMMYGSNEVELDVGP